VFVFFLVLEQTFPTAFWGSFDPFKNGAIGGGGEGDPSAGGGQAAQAQAGQPGCRRRLVEAAHGLELLQLTRDPIQQEEGFPGAIRSFLLNPPVACGSCGPGDEAVAPFRLGLDAGIPQPQRLPKGISIAHIHQPSEPPGYSRHSAAWRDGG
jgi:hypothetical protein